MKLFRVGKKGFIFRMTARDKKRLLDLLKLYPLVPVSHHCLSPGEDSPQAAENQRLLEESLAEQRTANRRQVEAMLKKPSRFRKTKGGLNVTFQPPEIEWLLQVLNDVRVGSWLALGAPQEDELPKVTRKNFAYFLAQETAGWFQSILLEALGVDQSPDWVD